MRDSLNERIQSVVAVPIAICRLFGIGKTALFDFVQLCSSQKE